MAETCPMHDVFRNDINDLYDKMEHLSKEVSDLREGAAGSREQLKTIFAMLERIEAMLRDYTIEMKATIHSVGDELEAVKSRPTRLWDGAVMALIAAAAGAIVTLLVK